MSAPTEASLGLIQSWQEEEDAYGRTSSYKGRGGDSSLQRILSRIVDDYQRDMHLRDTADPEYMAHLSAVGTRDAGAWLRAIPNKSLMLAFAPADFRAAALLRLYLFHQYGPCPHCDRPSGAPNGRHLLSCKRAPGTVARHNALRNCVHDAILASGNSAALEVTTGDGKQRPGDVVICGQPPTFIDVAIIHPLNAQYRAVKERAVDHYAATVKVAKYAGTLKNVGALFLPFVADIFGNLCAEAAGLVRRLGRSRATRLNESPHRHTWFLRVRISVTITAAVAKMLSPYDSSQHRKPQRRLVFLLSR
jgi:hypothetical protein